MRFDLDVSRAVRKVKNLREVVSKPFAGIRGRAQIKALRNVMRTEASRGVGFTASGGGVPFRPVLPFGTRPATNPPLGGPGSTYWQSWLGGEGSFTRITPKGVVIGSSLPWAFVHRGGTSEPASVVTVIKAKKKAKDGRYAMGHKLRGLYGVHIPEKTLARGLRVPSRPNVNPRAPQYRKAVSGEFELQLRKAAQ